MNLQKKSCLLSFCLTFFLGPIGLIYTAPIWGVVLTVIAYFTLGTLIIPVAIWLLSWGIGHYCACSHNENIDKLTAMMTNKA